MKNEACLIEKISQEENYTHPCSTWWKEYEQRKSCHFLYNCIAYSFPLLTLLPLLNHDLDGIAVVTAVVPLAYLVQSISGDVPVKIHNARRSSIPVWGSVSTYAVGCMVCTPRVSAKTTDKLRSLGPATVVELDLYPHHSFAQRGIALQSFSRLKMTFYLLPGKRIPGIFTVTAKQGESVTNEGFWNGQER